MRLHRFARLAAGPTAAALLGLGLVAAAPLSPAANAGPPSCKDAVSTAPTGPATVSAASTSYGKVLVVGAGDYAGCSLYVLTSDQLNALTTGAEPFACSGNADNALRLSCDTVLWPALLTWGAPIAGPGVNPTLLGSVTRTDVLTGRTVQQVTYAGLPLYRFFLDEAPGETEGANLFDPITDPQGTWYLVDPSRGRPAAGPARLQLETAQLGGAGPTETVLAVTMNNDFTAFPDAAFPVYTLSTDSHRSGDKSVCQGLCAQQWPPVLTAGRPEAGAGVDQHALGIVVRPDGTHQATYHGQPLYQYAADAYIGGITGTQGIYGAGVSTAWGVFSTVPPPAP